MSYSLCPKCREPLTTGGCASVLCGYTKLFTVNEMLIDSINSLENAIRELTNELKESKKKKATLKG